MQERGIPNIDIVVCGLYPFQEEVDKGDATTHENIIEKIDVGGPSMIRAAAKNHERVLVVCNAAQYEDIAYKIESDHQFHLWERERLAWQAFREMSQYAFCIEDYFHTREMARNRQEKGV
jgi:phosphoribosylaminoimidazolecarboxamide formyltransferase / IMP cyclohydrolase